MTFLQDSLERLYARRRFGIKPGLEAERQLLEYLGHPERAYGVLHVAGTNGKGSVCALAASALREAGLKVGLYTSPHLVRFNERIRVNGEPIGDDRVADLLRQIEEAAAQVAAARGREPTFFECATAMAFEAFRRAGVQLAVVETGMGGRLDATNVVEPLCSVITEISLEHTAFLGTSVGEIAREKAGIIKPGRPVIVGAGDPEARSVLEEEARMRSSFLSYAAECVTAEVTSRSLAYQSVALTSGMESYGRIRLPLLGDHQVDNAATAVAALEALSGTAGLDLPRSAVKRGFESVAWPGRFEVLREEPPVVLDGAHNPGAARVLARTLRQVLPGRSVGLVLGMCADKDAHAFLVPFAKRLRRVWLVPLQNDRSMPAADLRRAVPGGRTEVVEAALDVAMAEAAEWAEENGAAVCVTGSLFLVGEALSILGQ